ncbi:hypothetical protein PLICRDRAFT_40059 [Plicaturopsis crispa FD-325 SS-3]|nr:hypothetical protein PLICRDRAFT_40059 [Plicaturopsis crispa FD-325 SS-3]
MAPTTSLLRALSRRADDSTSSITNPIYLAGIAAAGALVLGCALWLIIRAVRKRAQAKRDNARGAAFLSVRGLVKEDADEKFPESSQVDVFSRSRLTESVVLPEKARLHPPAATHDDILDFHRRSGTIPRPFSFALHAPSRARSPSIYSTASSGSSSPVQPAFTRESSYSVTSGGAGSRFSMLSAASSQTATAGHARKVRQLFNPVLPDELLITHVGERLTVVQSFDDGWCVVARESAGVFQGSKSKAFGAKPSDDGVELGVVPAWSFIKPVKGLRAERPVRSSSLGITVEIERPGMVSRDEVISWSNF